METKITEPIRITYTFEFKRNIRALAKKYRHIREDLQPVIEELQAGHMLGDQITGSGYTVFKVRVRNQDISKGKRSGAIKRDIDPNHPIVKMSQEIEQAIKRKKNLSVFNLGDTLEFLTHPPFGMYSNMVYFGALGFLLRDYVGKLYEAGKGKPLEKEMMRDRIVDLFNYWQSGKGSEKLEVRMGTEEEKHLLRKLTDIFALPGIESLNDVKWGIRAWIKTSQYPLWVFTCSEHANAHVNEAIDNIIRLIETRDADLVHTQIQGMLQVVQAVKDDLRLLIFKPERSRDLFVRWLKQIENLEIRDDKLEEVIQFIRRNMPEEIGVDAWKADNVREKVKDWYIRDMEQAKPKPPEPPTPVPPKPYPFPPEPPQPPTVNENQILAKIEAYGGLASVAQKNCAGTSRNYCYFRAIFMNRLWERRLP